MLKSSSKYQNLHSHTFTSDGRLSYLETLKICWKNNIGAVAFTDHDSLPSKKAVKQLSENRAYPVKWILGIEITSELPKELGERTGEDLHILGLFVNPFDKRLQEYCRKYNESGLYRAKEMVKNFKALGFEISFKDCQKQSRGKTFQRPHVVAALMKKKKNLDLMEEFKEKMKKESRKDPQVREKFRLMIKEGIRQYPYTLFLSPDAYIKGVYVKHFYTLGFDQCVRLIRNAGGKAFLAHWTFRKRSVNLELVEGLLKEKRLDGLETVYNAHHQGREKEVLADMKIMKRLAEKYGVLESGGIDSHFKEDLISFSKDKLLAAKTIGLAEKIIERSKIDTRWSSFVKI